jgi:exodeoxyribonuclease-3
MAFQALLDTGLTDCWRLFDDREGRHAFTWWDYRNGGWARNAGLRIDHILASQALTRVCRDCRADVGERGRKRPSDHVPVLADFALSPTAGQPDEVIAGRALSAEIQRNND